MRAFDVEKMRMKRSENGHTLPPHPLWGVSFSFQESRSSRNQRTISDTNQYTSKMNTSTTNTASTNAINVVIIL